MMSLTITPAAATILVPPVTARSAAVLLFVLSGVVLATHSVLAALAAQRAALTPRARNAAPLLVAAFLAMWLAAALVTADAAHFPLAPSTSRLAVVLLVMLVPFVAAIALLFGSKTMRAVNAAMPSSWLVRMQSYRLAGFIFLFPYLYYGVLPGAFAWPAAVGDMLTGAFALVVAHAIATNRPGIVKWAVVWNLFGILDLIVAPLAAVHSAATVITYYPLAIVPLFLGPPLGMLTHIYSLRNLAASRHRAAVAGDIDRQARLVAHAGHAPATSI